MRLSQSIYLYSALFSPLPITKISCADPEGFTKRLLGHTSAFYEMFDSLVNRLHQTTAFLVLFERKLLMYVFFSCKTTYLRV